jgi:hypothetical protein
MARNERTTKIKNRHGKAHEYRMIPLGSDDCLDFGLELADMIGGPVGKAITDALFSSGKPEVDTDLNWGTIISAAVSLPRALREAGGSQFFERIFADNTVRKIVPQKAGKAKALMLGESSAREEAFEDGNLAEMLEAAVWVIRENYGPFWTAASGRFGALLQAGAELLGVDASEATTNEPQTENISNG